jgi:hypothetical protein
MQQEWLRKPDGNRQLVQLFPDDINAGKELFHGLSIRDALLPSQPAGGSLDLERLFLQHSTPTRTCHVAVCTRWWEVIQ